MSVLFGVACCGLGAGSGLYHASLTRWGQHLDVASMYPPLLVCIAINLGRLTRRKGCGAGLSAGARSWLLASAVATVSFLLYRYKWSMSSFLVLTTLILTVGICGLWDLIFTRRELHFRWLGWATGALAGRYASFNAQQGFVAPSTKRAAGGITADIKFAGSMTDFVLDSNALKASIDNEIEVPLAGDNISIVEESKVTTLLALMMRYLKSSITRPTTTCCTLLSSALA
jgi:hypothetical protein